MGFCTNKTWAGFNTLFPKYLWFLALLAKARRAYGMVRCPSSVVRPSVRRRPSVVRPSSVRPSSVNNLHFQLLLWNCLPNLTKLCRNDVWMVLHKNTTFRSGWKNKMAARANSRILIGRFSKIFSSETTWPNSAKLYRNDVWDGSPQKYHFSFRSNKQDGRHWRLFWIGGFKKKIFLKFWFDFKNLAGMTLGWSSAKI